MLEFGVFAGQHAGRIHQEDQLVGIQRHGRRGGHVFERQIENLAGRRITDRRQQHEFVVVEPVADARRINLAHLTGVQQINTVDHTDRLGRHEVAAGDTDVRTGHRRIRQAHRQQRLDLDAHAPARLFGARQRNVIGDTQAVDETRAVFELLQPRLDLRPRAMHQHETHADASQQVQVMNQRDELRAVIDHLAAESNDEGAPAKRVHIRRRGAEPSDEIGST